MNDKLTCVRVLREARSKKESNQMLFGIPQEHKTLLGWNPGDKVIVTSDKKSDTITLKRVTDGEN